MPECSNRYFGKQVKFVVKAKIAKQVKLGTLKAVTIAGALVRLYLISVKRARYPGVTGAIDASAATKLSQQ